MWVVKAGLSLLSSTAVVIEGLQLVAVNHSEPRKLRSHSPKPVDTFYSAF